MNAPLRLLSPSLLAIAIALPLGPIAAGELGEPAVIADLPVERVVLSTAGVGFFQHGGRVTNDATVELSFTPQQLNDLLKSLVVQDFDGGRVLSVAYPSQEPLDRLLGSFAINLSGNPSQAALLSQLRGAEIRLGLEAGESVSGRVLGTETRAQAVGEVVIQTTFVSIAASDGIRAVNLDRVRRFELADPQLQAELNKALGALAEGRNADKKPVAIRFAGNGDRRVAIGYVVEAPIWKASYRLVLPAAGTEGKPAIQGWAIVENTTEHDWNGIELALISGRPLSFVEDLYQPQFLRRPVHQPQRFAGLGPQAYETGMAADSEMAGGGPAREQGRLRQAPSAPAPAMARRSAMMDSVSAEASFGARAEGVGMGDVTGSVQAAAGTENLGATFQYTVQAIDIPRRRSAMLPIVAEAIEAHPVSIYDRNVLARHPLRGTRLVNSTGKHLPGGPLTVLEGAGYAGDARIDDLPAGGERLLSFAIDLEMTVQLRDPGTETVLAGGRLERGILHLEQRRSRKTTYAIANQGLEGRKLLLAHPVSHGWDLGQGLTPTERTEAQYRFSLDLKPTDNHDFTIEETRVDWEMVQIGSLNDRAIASWASNGKLPAAVRAALTRAADLRRAVVAAEREVSAPQARIQEITSDQSRIRENLRTLQRGSELHERLIARLGQQETELDTLNQQLVQARMAQAAAQKALEEYLSELNVR